MERLEESDYFFFCLYNAWEDGDEVVVIGSSMTPANIIFKTSEVLHAVLTEDRLNQATGMSTKSKLASLNLEVEKMNPRYVGVRIQFMYLAIVELWPKVSNIAKVDLQSSQVVARHNYGAHCFGGEPVHAIGVCLPSPPRTTLFCWHFAMKRSAARASCSS